MNLVVRKNNQQATEKKRRQIGGKEMTENRTYDQTITIICSSSELMVKSLYKLPAKPWLVAEALILAPNSNTKSERFKRITVNILPDVRLFLRKKNYQDNNRCICFSEW
jgi:hypothetical protein